MSLHFTARNIRERERVREVAECTNFMHKREGSPVIAYAGEL